MLDNIRIKNYKNLRDLTIPSLSRVNLFAGKNNAGKTSILEAISLYARKGEIGYLFDLLESMGEAPNTGLSKNGAQGEHLMKSISTIFSDRKIAFSEADRVEIGPVLQIPIAENFKPDQKLELGLVKIGIEEIRSESGDLVRSKKVLREGRIGKHLDLEIQFGFEQGFGGIFDVFLMETMSKRPKYQSSDLPPMEFINAQNYGRQSDGTLWDKITLTEKEAFVIEALRLIEPRVERIAFIAKYESGIERAAVFKLIGKQTTLPISGMGDGMKRVLTIILALVNSDNGYLFIDEFENGLHYSVQEKLWEIIFSLSEKLGVQIFATTHSSDCIRAFQSILNRNENQTAGQYIRVDLKGENPKVVEFDARELLVAEEQDIEIR